jgi:hypothetical protein
VKPLLLAAIPPYSPTTGRLPILPPSAISGSGAGSGDRPHGARENSIVHSWLMFSKETATHYPSSASSSESAVFAFFEAQSSGPPMPPSPLQATSRNAFCKTEGQDGVAVSFLAGLFHSLQYAGLLRRSLMNATIGIWETVTLFPKQLSENMRQHPLSLGALCYSVVMRNSSQFETKRWDGSGVLPDLA